MAGINWLVSPKIMQNKREWAKVYELMCPHCGCELHEHPYPPELPNFRAVQCISPVCRIVYVYERHP